MEITIQVSGSVGDRKSTVLRRLVRFLSTIGDVKEIHQNSDEPNRRRIIFNYKEQ